MPRRMRQIFALPSGIVLPPEATITPWATADHASLPLEHWFVILDFLRSGDPAGAALLERASDLGLPAQQDLPDWLPRLDATIDAAAERIRHAAPLVPLATDEFPENFAKSEHVAMLQAVRSVVAQAARAGRMFGSWKE
jgi:hypothetical protein